MQAIPKLDEIAHDPALAIGLPRDVQVTLLSQCGAAQGALIGAMSGGDRASSNGDTVGGSLVVTVEEAAEMLSVSCDWIYRRGKRLGIAVKLDDGTLRFSRAAILELIEKNLIPKVPRRPAKAA